MMLAAAVKITAQLPASLQIPGGVGVPASSGVPVSGAPLSGIASGGCVVASGLLLGLSPTKGGVLSEPHPAVRAQRVAKHKIDRKLGMLIRVNHPRIRRSRKALFALFGAPMCATSHLAIDPQVRRFDHVPLNPRLVPRRARRVVMALLSRGP
jgi:hypothetical protein